MNDNNPYILVLGASIDDILASVEEAMHKEIQFRGI